MRTHRFAFTQQRAIKTTFTMTIELLCQYSAEVAVFYVFFLRTHVVLHVMNSELCLYVNIFTALDRGLCFVILRHRKRKSRSEYCCKKFEMFLRMPIKEM